MKKKTNFHSFETYGIFLQGSMVFYKSFKIFYGGFETYDILGRF